MVLTFKATALRGQGSSARGSPSVLWFESGRYWGSGGTEAGTLPLLSLLLLEPVRAVLPLETERSAQGFPSPPSALPAVSRLPLPSTSSALMPSAPSGVCWVCCWGLGLLSALGGGV